MPIDISAIFKQLDRNNSQLIDGGTGNSFFYLIESADIDYRVEGRLSQQTVLGDNPTVKDSFGTKYIVLDVNDVPHQITLPQGIENGDIIERRNGVWGIHLDVSGINSRGGALVYSKGDKKFYYYDSTEWVELGEGSLTGAAGETWSVQFRAADGSLSGNNGLLFNNTTRQLVLGSDVVVAFGDGTTQGTARNFFGVTGPTSNPFPIGMSGAGNTGDRLLVATGSSADPFRNYVKFGNAWFQTGVVGIGQGPKGDKGDQGDTGNTGNTGPAGSTGFGFTAAFVSGDSLYISVLFPDGTSGSSQNIGYVKGNTGADGTNGTNGNDGATGSTGFGFTAAQVSGDGNLYISVLFPDGTSGPGQNIGLVRGATGFTGATGSTGFGFTAAFVSGDGNLYISVLFPNGTSGPAQNIGYVKGETGNTGTFVVDEGNQGYTVRTVDRLIQGVTGFARKVAFLLDDGSLTFDYVKEYDVRNRYEYEFAVTNLSAGDPTYLSSFVQRMSSSDIKIAGSGNPVWLADFRLDSALTASVVATDGIGPWYANDLVGGSNIEFFGSDYFVPGTGGADRQITFTIQATGNDAPGDPYFGAERYSTRSLTMLFRNEFMYGATTAASISGGSTGMGAGWWSKDFTSAKPVAEKLGGYAFNLNIPSGGNHYVYFAYPERLHEENVINFYVEGAALLGGYSLQGFRAVPGLSALNYTNDSGFTEKYKVWRTEQAFGSAINPFTTTVYGLSG